MTKIGTVFQFVAPGGWNQYQDGNRYIYHGPSQEELIVSAQLVQGAGTMEHLAAMQRQLLQHAQQSVKNAAAHPALSVIQPLTKEPRVSTLECWSLKARTHAGDTLFYQAVFQEPRGVLLATLEAPNTTRSVDIFGQFIISVGAVSESGAPTE